MSTLTKDLEKLLKQEKDKSKEVREQLEFIKKAQRQGIIKKPEYNLASVVNVVTSV